MERVIKMAKGKTAPFGLWKSPITSELIASRTVWLSQIASDEKDVYWVEMRPSEGGRSVIVRSSSDGSKVTITPSSFNVRNMVHEYGGAAFCVQDGIIYFSNFNDQRLYCQGPDDLPNPITPPGDWRYADGIIDRKRKQIICIREDHHEMTGEADNSLISIGLKNNKIKVLVSGSDFYTSPCLSPDGSQLAWISWNHPNMPWDGTELWTGRFNLEGSIVEIVRVGGGLDESIIQPEWSPDGLLYFVSDRTGWWNLYRKIDSGVEPIAKMDADFGRPSWIFGNSSYAFESSKRIICAYTRRGIWRLLSLDAETHRITPIKTPYTDIACIRALPDYALFVGGSPKESISIVRLNLSSHEIEILCRSTAISIDNNTLSIPTSIEFPTSGGMKAHAFIYLPKNKKYIAYPWEKPPLIVMCHGGPTFSASTSLSLIIQYWTSRGFAVVDVNYRGSSGYGKEYRSCLYGQWGIIDVDDCVNAANFLVNRGKVDGKRLAIRGGSAGGFTTLCALTFHNVFTAGASYYGVSDLENLAKETHKFESHYIRRLIGPNSMEHDLYHERSPFYFLDCISCPIILFQGLEDKIVPPNQAKTIYEALRAKGLPVAYIPFEREQHGLRLAENIKMALDAEYLFYIQAFNINYDAQKD